MLLQFATARQPRAGGRGSIAAHAPRGHAAAVSAVVLKGTKLSLLVGSVSPPLLVPNDCVWWRWLGHLD
jgi:hypothetical protein